MVIQRKIFENIKSVNDYNEKDIGLVNSHIDKITSILKDIDILEQNDISHERFVLEDITNYSNVVNFKAYLEDLYTQKRAHELSSGTEYLLQVAYQKIYKKIKTKS